MSGAERLALDRQVVGEKQGQDVAPIVRVAYGEPAVKEVRGEVDDAFSLVVRRVVIIPNECAIVLIPPILVAVAAVVMTAAEVSLFLALLMSFGAGGCEGPRRQMDVGSKIVSSLLRAAVALPDAGPLGQQHGR